MAISSMQQPRQMYGLGSFVKKFTRPLKKIVKSPLGKAALLGGAAYLGGGALGGTGGFSNFAQLGNSAKNLLFGKMTNMGPASAGRSGGLSSFLRGGLNKFNNLSFGKKPLTISTSPQTIRIKPKNFLILKILFCVNFLLSCLARRILNKSVIK